MAGKQSVRVSRELKGSVRQSILKQQHRKNSSAYAENMAAQQHQQEANITVSKGWTPFTRLKTD